jgi:ankyrin repeat protein
MHLHAAAARGDLAEIRHALAHGTDINARDSLGCTALQAALGPASPASPIADPKVRLATIESLLSAGADLHGLDDLGRRAIHLAVGVGDLEILRALIRHGAGIRQISRSRYSALVLAAYKPAGPDKLRLIEFLIDAGVDRDLETEFSETPLSVCLLLGDFASLRLLLERGANSSPLAWTPLHRAVAFGRLEDVAELANSPAVINEPRDRWGHSPWQLAVRVGHLEIVELLAHRGADLVQRDRHGRSLLHLAAQTNSHAVPWLIRYGAELEAVDDSGHTALNIASEYDAINAARHLLAAGAGVHRENRYLAHPINGISSLAMLRLLGEAGADLDFVDGCGDWPLKNAAEANDTDRVAWLLAHGAKVDNTSTGETALHAAVRADAREAMDQLLAAGANPNAQDVDGWTPFFCARSREAIHRLRKGGGDPTIRDQVGGLPAGSLEDPLLRSALTEPLS